jgi:hypothetical protein
MTSGAPLPHSPQVARIIAGVNIVGEAMEVVDPHS